MAWRPTEYLIEGELDNTYPNKVTGWMRFAGVKEKGMVILEPDIDAFKSTAAKIVKEKLDGSVWPAGLYEKIRAMD